MLRFPAIDPVMVSIGPLEIHWYGIMYLLSFTLAWVLGRWRNQHYHLNWTNTEISDVIFYGALGVIIGGRLGYMLFYNTAVLLAEPLRLFKVWEGGMSFHGGVLGVIVGLVYFARRTRKPLLNVSDFIIPLVPVGLAAGRVGNFINGELWGRVTTMPWGMIFPHAGPEPRHPSQLYELGLEGFFLFVLVWWYARKPRPAGMVSAMFLMGYAACRFLVEFFREPDTQLGFVAFDWITMGQLLSIPMLLVGFGLWWAKR